MSTETKLDDDVRARVPGEMVEELQEIAHERTEPGNRVFVSDIVREALAEYLEQDREEN